MDSLALLDVVVLLTDLPAERLRKGSLGTIVDVFDGINYLVEFADMNGITYAIPVLAQSHLLKVYQEPVAA